MAFLETPRFPEDISYGSRGGPMFNTLMAVMGSGYETANAGWEYPMHKWNVAYGVKTAAQAYELKEYFMVALGMANRFRFKDWHDYNSSTANAATTDTDQAIGTGDGTTLSFQLKKTYTKGALTLQRTITKPVSATVSAAIGGVTDPRWSVVYSTGSVVFSADLSTNVSGITQAAQARVSATGHALSSGDSAFVSGVFGMVEINSARYAVTSTSANHFKLNVNSSAFSAYTSGGVVHTIPQSGESVTAGFEFDVPVRFDVDFLDVAFDDYDIRSAQINVMEVRL